MIELSAADLALVEWVADPHSIGMMPPEGFRGGPNGTEPLIRHLAALGVVPEPAVGTPLAQAAQDAQWAAREWLDAFRRATQR